ncbi:MAG: hypothetical protein R3D84_08560 [Paracoccaceae bacterium]
MWAWLRRNAEPLEAAGALVTALAALAALVVIPWQIAAADRIGREQTAREIYREFLNLTAQKPELAAADYCDLPKDRDRVAYTAYVEYLLYTTEQMVDTDPDWRGPMESYLADHMTYLCSNEDWASLSEDVYAIVQGLKAGCGQVAACPQG